MPTQHLGLKTSNSPEIGAFLPKTLQDALISFLLEKQTGNIQINVRQGVIMGFRTETLHSTS
mgnify:CR=1 FL=1